MTLIINLGDGTNGSQPFNFYLELEFDCWIVDAVSDLIWFLFFHTERRDRLNLIEIDSDCVAIFIVYKLSFFDQSRFCLVLLL